MPARSLSRVLARQWVLFTLCLSALLLASSLLLLFLLEDSFIDRRLREFARQVVDVEQPPRLPSQFVLYRREALPAELRLRTQALALDQIAEFRRTNGRYVHVLHARSAAGTPFRLVYDVTDELTVTVGLERAAPYLLVMVAVLALLAYALAATFVRRTARRAEDLLALVRSAAEPAALRARAQAEPVHELGELARLLADAWDQRLAALQREQQTLAFLAHELRTPLQSARTSLALMRGGQASPLVLARLQRAVDRLARASNSVLWLSSDAATESHRTELPALLDDLVREFAPLAESRRQSLHSEIAGAIVWQGPREVLEAVLGNLLLNAIQHGAPGHIDILASAACIRVRNPIRAAPTSPGFGLGLQIVERLCLRCGWQLQHAERDGVIEQQISVGPAEPR